MPQRKEGILLTGFTNPLFGRINLLSDVYCNNNKKNTFWLFFLILIDGSDFFSIKCQTALPPSPPLPHPPKIENFKELLEVEKIFFPILYYLERGQLVLTLSLSIFLS